MKVLMLTGLATDLRTLDPDNTYDLPSDEAKRLIAAGFAEAVQEIETATVTHTRNRMLRHERKQGVK